MIKTASIGDVGSISLPQGWMNPLPYARQADGRIIVAKTEVKDAPILYYVDHVVQMNDWRVCVELLDSKLHGESLNAEDLKLLSSVLKVRLEHSAYFLSFHKDIISGREGFQGWVTARDKDLKTLPFIYPVKQTASNIIEEIGCEGPTANKELWVEAIRSLTKSTEWLHS